MDLQEERLQKPLLDRRAMLWIGGYLLLYGLLLFVLHHATGFDISEPLIVLGIVGILFSGIAWLVTSKIAAPSIEVRTPRKEFLVLLGWIFIVSLYFVRGPDYLSSKLPNEPLHSLVITAIKLLLFVVLPTLIFKALGYSFAQLAPIRLSWRAMRPVLLMAPIMIAFQMIFGRGLQGAAAGTSGLRFASSLLAVFVWLVIDVGLVEEYFFRSLVQERAARLTGSNWGGIVLASVLFGLMHVPGLYLRTQVTQEGLGPNPSFIAALAYAYVITTVAGFFLGVLWARTKNLAVPVLVHAATDLIPQTLPMAAALGLLHGK